MVASLVGVLSFILFLLFQAIGISGGDSGDLVTAGFEFGVPHPPGYPLYTMFVWLVTRIPLFTPAWRAALISSIPHAITLVVVYLLTKRLSGSIFAGLFAMLMLLGNYIFFLYSVTPEVFALFDLFIVLLIYFLDSPYLFSFIFGLAISHHHVILFLVPAMGWFLYNHYKNYKNYNIYIFGLLFLLGLLPYFYIPLAARGAAIVNWDRAIDVQGFLRLLTRQDYGSFVANGFYGSLPIHRLLQLQAYGKFLLLDLTWIGIALGAVGFIFLWFRKRRMFWLLFLSLLSIGPGFFFYASFPLMNRFSLGTYERFLLPSYTILSVVVGVGFGQLIRIKRLFLILFILPLIIGFMTTWRFWGLREDRTADYLGEDILMSIPQESILLLSRDTPLFISQYVRYGLGVRSDVILLHANRLWSNDYPQAIRLRFPELAVPESEPGKFALALVRANRDRYPIYTNTTFPVDDGWFWVQQGLVYKLTPKDSLPSLSSFVAKNDQLWGTFHDPRQGILSRYNHLMLSDIVSVYADSRISVGKTILRGGNTTDAKRYFREAISYKSDIEEQDGYTYLGLAELFDGNCDEAITAFAKARAASLVPDTTLTFYEGVTYRDCAKNIQKSKELLDRYEELQNTRDIPLR